MQLNLFEDDEPNEDTKEDQLQCPICKECKPERDFYNLPKQAMQAKKPKRSGSWRWCRRCFNENTLLVVELKKENKYPQNPSCNCCGVKPKDYDKLQLDHCHENKVFRGWLCRSCNVGIGQLGDNLEGVEKAIAYLRKHNEQQS